ncbi:MAG: sodium/glutamate symporter [Peptoniphilaceae bacterium]|nr:sodium/glutamate symporter [Peptoniphilaceae bacterium]MDY3075267.1 sodium/glutamate symporter [Peptoniphilaceae bacterium]
MEIAANKVLMTAVDDLSVLMVFLLLGFALRQFIKPLQKLFLPAGLIGGALALILGPQVLGWIGIPATWSGMPTPMINIVLTCTIFGTSLNKSVLKNYAGAINLIILTYFSQMIIGTLVGMGLSRIWPELPYAWGVMAIFTYWGGHGAATTAGTIFESMGNDGMLSLGIILATLGLVVAMLIGMILVNYGVRKGYASNMEKVEKAETKVSALLPLEKQKSLGRATVSSDAVNGLALQFSLVLVSILIGKGIFQLLGMVPVQMIADIAGMIPSLLYGIVGAFIVWGLMKKLGIEGYASQEAIDNISGVALEICILSATATLNLKFFASFLAPILIHMVCIIVIMVFICMVLLKRWLKQDWFELALMAFGQGEGSTPSGLALARCVDPDHKSTSWEAFGIALGLFTPITSTLAAVLPLLVMQSQWYPVLIGGVVTGVCLFIGEGIRRSR